MAIVNLRSFLRPHLDVLFVALNPPEQSNSNGHYFSGAGSRFFLLLHESGLIVRAVTKTHADEIVFGSTSVNHSGMEFGVVDLVPDVVQTDSGKVRPTKEHVDALLMNIRHFGPRIVCIIHAKVRDALVKHGGLAGPLNYGVCGAVLPACGALVVMNYFPNGNAVPDEPKLRIYRELRALL